MPDLAPPGYGRDPYGRPQRRPRTAPKKRFYLSVFDFVFGPKAAPRDPRAGGQAPAWPSCAITRGASTAAELSALTGLSLAAAEEELTRLMVEYDGEVEVADDGTLLYRVRGAAAVGVGGGDALDLGLGPGRSGSGR